MEWATWGATLGAKIGGKILLNACLPGLGSAVDFVEAGTCFKNGDVSGCVISTLLGVGELVTLGAVGAAKEAMNESAKGAAIQSAKDTAKAAGKKASKKVGQDLAKQFAMGTTKGGKDAAIAMAKKAAKAASKEATKKVGHQVGKEIAKGVIPSAVEEVWFQGTKMTAEKFLVDTWLSFQSSGIHQVGKTILEDWIEMAITEGLKRKPTEMAFELVKEAAKKGAEKEFMNQSFKLFAKDLILSKATSAAKIASFAVAQGGISCATSAAKEASSTVAQGGVSCAMSAAKEVSKKKMFEKLLIGHGKTLKLDDSFKVVFKDLYMAYVKAGMVVVSFSESD